MGLLDPVILQNSHIQSEYQHLAVRPNCPLRHQHLTENARVAAEGEGVAFLFLKGSEY